MQMPVSQDREVVMRIPILSFGCLFLLTSGWAGEEPVKFSAKPAATRGSDKVKIDFTANRETDVTVAIQDAQGKVVRHLAGGVLNKTAPEPLKPGLSQSIEWDGKDDSGKTASGGPFK